MNPRYGVNGALWTLPIEVFCHVMLFALGLIGVLRSRILGSLVMAGIVVYTAITPRYLFMFGLPDGEARYLPGLFTFGALLAINRDHCDISIAAALALALLACMLRNTPVFPFVFYAAAFYGAAAVSITALLRATRLPGDFSYGVFTCTGGQSSSA